MSPGRQSTLSLVRELECNASFIHTREKTFKYETSQGCNYQTKVSCMTVTTTQINCFCNSYILLVISIKMMEEVKQNCENSLTTARLMGINNYYIFIFIVLQ